MEATLARIEAAERERAQALERARRAEETAAAERERARSGCGTGAKGGRRDACRRAPGGGRALTRAEREVAEVRREVTRQRNLRGATTSPAARQLAGARAASRSGCGRRRPHPRRRLPKKRASPRRSAGRAPRSQPDARQRGTHRRRERPDRPGDAGGRREPGRGAGGGHRDRARADQRPVTA